MEDYKYKLSIIIPMYNSEKYIANCLNSILNSDLPKGEYEVVIINDGATDNGLQIVQEYVSKYDNFTYLTQENQGQSVARNNGIENCHGEYIWFIDSDDMICQYQNVLFNFLLNHPDADIIKSVIKTYQEGEPVEYEQLDGSHTLMSGRDLLLSGYHPSSVCNMIFRKSIVVDNNIRFIPGIVRQDVEFSHRLYSLANHVYTFKYITYLYLHNSNSTTQSKEVSKVIKKEVSNIVVSKSFLDFSQKLFLSDPELSHLFGERSGNILLGLLFSMIKQRKDRKETDINQRILDQMIQEGVYPINIRFDTFKKTLVKKLLNIEVILRHII